MSVKLMERRMNLPCSDEKSESDADLKDDKSALLSFFVETKEMVRHAIRNVRDFGSTVSDNVSAIGSSVMDRSGRADDASVLSSMSSIWDELQTTRDRAV